MSDVNADRLAKIYVKIREKRLALEKQVQELQDQQELVAREILDICKEQGTMTMRTEHGTISRRTNTRYWTSDWESMHKFILDHQMPELLEKRVSQSTMKQLLDENPDMMPPGMNVDSKYAVTIRRSTSGS